MVRASDPPPIEMTVVRNSPVAASKFGQIRSVYFACIFRKRHKNPFFGSFLPGVYARGSKIYHTGGIYGIRFVGSLTSTTTTYAAS